MIDHKLYHTVENFPKNYSWFKKKLANFFFYFGSTIIRKPTTHLSKKDILSLKKKIKKGDILFTGKSNTILSSLLRYPVTHTMLYIWDNTFLHAKADGIISSDFDFISDFYHSYVLWRVIHRSDHKKEIKDSIQWSKKKKWSPYNFFFSEHSSWFFCTQFIQAAYKHAHLDLWVDALEHHHILGWIFSYISPLSPKHFLEDWRIKIVDNSHNLTVWKKKNNHSVHYKIRH